MKGRTLGVFMDHRGESPARRGDKIRYLVGLDPPNLLAQARVDDSQFWSQPKLKLTTDRPSRRRYCVRYRSSSATRR